MTPLSRNTASPLISSLCPAPLEPALEGTHSKRGSYDASHNDHKESSMAHKILSILALATSLGLALPLSLPIMEGRMP